MIRIEVTADLPHHLTASQVYIMPPCSSRMCRAESQLRLLSNAEVSCVF